MRSLIILSLACAVMAAAAISAELVTAPAYATNHDTPHPIAVPVASALVPIALDGTDQDSTIFFEDFEAQPSDWEMQDLTDVGPQWHPDPFNAYSGNSWWCGDSLWMGYYNLWLQYLVTPTLNLQGTTNPQLTFRLRWAMESSTSVPPPPPYNGWDGCNVWISTDNGGTWQVITPISPNYTCANLSSFGTVWGFGPGIPGWADSSGGWQLATFELSSYQTRNVKIRWALCSDRAVCSYGHPEITGLFVDDILLMSGADTLLWNNADGAQYPAPLTFDTGPPFGDWWEWTTLDAHSPTHSMRVDDDHFYINDALISPPIDIPEGYTTRFKYWVRCDLPDSTHAGSNALRDYYFVEASTDGEAWDTLFYDYARGGAGYPGWAQMVPGLPYNGNMEMDLSEYAGQTIQLRWRAITDGDHTSGNGQGLFIDDVEVYVNAIPANDVGITSVYVPFPTVEGFEGTVTVSNFGLNQNTFYAFWRTNGQLHYWGATPSWTLPGETDSTVTISYEAAPGSSIFVDSYTVMMGDMNPANDTSWAGAIDIFPQGAWMFELGYDARGYSYLPTLLALHYYQGNGPLVRYDQNVMAGWGWMRCLFWEPGTFEMHFYDQGTLTTPGPEYGSIPVTVAANEIYPNWKVIDISAIPEMNYRGPADFWVWLEMTQAGGGPNMVADYEHFGQGFFFDYNGSSVYDTQYDFYIRALANDNTGVQPEPPTGVPSSFRLNALYPNPFNPTTQISFELPVASWIGLKAYDLTGKLAATIVSGNLTAGRHEAKWNAEGLPSGIYLLRLESAWGAEVKKAIIIK